MVTGTNRSCFCCISGLAAAAGAVAGGSNGFDFQSVDGFDFQSGEQLFQESYQVQFFAFFLKKIVGCNFFSCPIILSSITPGSKNLQNCMTSKMDGP